jgi:DNA-directed RNA polymerase subunit M/transcription elongation factor TFIIS
MNLPINRGHVSLVFSTLFNNNSIGELIETSIYDYSVQDASRKNVVNTLTNQQFMIIYNSRLKSLFTNINKQKDLENVIESNGDVDETIDKTFYQKIIDGEFTSKQLSEITHIDMEYKRWKTKLSKKAIKDNNMYVNKAKASTNMYVCGKCKSRECTYYEMQTRSADEPTTVFLTCLNCDKHWKI